jgi:hypothetical protein
VAAQKVWDARAGVWQPINLLVLEKVFEWQPRRYGMQGLGQKYDCASTLVSSRGKLATIYEASVEAAN